MNDNKKDNRPFCFCVGQQVDCIPGVVLDCNNKRTKKCPLEDKEKVEKKKKSKTDETNQNGQKNKKEKKEKDNRAFCFCVGELVDCIPGVVLDCNNKRTSICPLESEKEKAGKNNENKAAETNQGNQKNKAEKKNQKNRKNKTEQANQDSKKDKAGKDNRAFCFCVGELVDCIPGVVLDCNNKRTKKCPLLEDEAERKTKEFEQAMRAHKAYSRKEKKQEPVEIQGKEFCFCLGELVDCPPATVQDCNLKKTTTCKLGKS